MKLKKVAILLLVLVPLLLIIGGTVSFFAYKEMQSQHELNLAELEKFGYQMVPTDVYTESVGELGAEQLPATFSEKKLTPTERVIRGLMQDKENLLAEQQALKDQITALEQQIAELEDYKRLNQHFAPASFEEELAETKSVLKSTLARMPESEPFDNTRLEVMAAAGTHEYRRFVSANRLMLDRPHRAQIIEELLPVYAFCVGNAVDLAANSRSEEQLLTQWFTDPEKTRLPAALATDLNKLLPACQLPLREQLQKILPTMAAG
ncbi:hypothetical protein [Marinobacterium sediminicola]|uniref:Uncharacterized protein n=1 Tax=Marinobacterium sediminicola TaxID=518898 RepID=A0ABY1S3K3_9GAMM|nr:hypothetical protein [Marinobacterium sediminicola]ULG68159.1 hypothetical protein LN244_10635 [Marinobacterium sediminicola]SMR77685.1 hypothetical protein SAMN04487964_11618 [Marinobacterium sediminicola]